MKDLEKEFVPYEPSLELKELGFDEPCFATYDEDKNFELQDFFQTYETFPSHIIAAPTFSQCFRWFREKYNLSGFVLPWGEKLFDFKIYSIKEGEHLFGSPEYLTYEEAEIACLQKLITLVKDEKHTHITNRQTK